MLAASAHEHAQIRVRSDLPGFSKIATDNSGNPQLQLVTEVTKESYCEGPDPELFTLRLLLRLSFTNVGGQKLILERGSKSVPVIRISKAAEDAIAGRFETTINNYIITSNSKGPNVPKRPPLGGFAVLAPGQSYETSAEISIPVPRANPVPAIINTGSHYLQIGVWTWDESQNEAEVRRTAWQDQGFLWSESVFSKPMPFTVRSQVKPANCLCDNPSIGEMQAINIAVRRLKTLQRASASYRPVAIAQDCEWHVVFESKVKESNEPGFTLSSTKAAGRFWEFERFNRSYRQAVLDVFVFQTLNEVREQTEMWLKEYNEERPHDALGDMTPRECLLTQKAGSLYLRVDLKADTYTWLNNLRVSVRMTRRMVRT